MCGGMSSSSLRQDFIHGWKVYLPDVDVGAG